MDVTARVGDSTENGEQVPGSSGVISVGGSELLEASEDGLSPNRVPGTYLL